MISKYVRWLWKAEGVVQKFPPDIGPNPIRIQDTLPIGRPDFSSSGPQDLSLKRIKTAFFCLCLSSTTVEMWVSQSQKKTAVQETLLVLESLGIKRKWSRVGGETSPWLFLVTPGSRVAWGEDFVFFPIQPRPELHTHKWKQTSDSEMKAALGIVKLEFSNFPKKHSLNIIKGPSASLCHQVTCLVKIISWLKPRFSAGNVSTLSPHRWLKGYTRASPLKSVLGKVDWGLVLPHTKHL